MNTPLTLPFNLAKDLFDSQLISVKVAGQSTLLNGRIEVSSSEAGHPSMILRLDAPQHQSGIVMANPSEFDVSQEMFDGFSRKKGALAYYGDLSGLQLIPRKPSR